MLALMAPAYATLAAWSCLVSPRSATTLPRSKARNRGTIWRSSNSLTADSVKSIRTSSSTRQTRIPASPSSATPKVMPSRSTSPPRDDTKCISVPGVACSGLRCNSSSDTTSAGSSSSTRLPFDAGAALLATSRIRRRRNAGSASNPLTRWTSLFRNSLTRTPSNDSIVSRIARPIAFSPAAFSFPASSVAFARIESASRRAFATLSEACFWAEVTSACAWVRPCAIPSSRNRSMRVSTPAASAAGVACDPLDERAASALADVITGACAMTVSTFRDRCADDECKHERKHGEAFNDRRRRHRDPENRGLAFAGVDRGSTTLALEDGDVEQRYADQKPHAEQARRSRRVDCPIEAEHDDDAVDDDRGRQDRQSDVASIAAVDLQDGAARGLSSRRTADCTAD